MLANELTSFLEGIETKVSNSTRNSLRLRQGKNSISKYEDIQHYFEQQFGAKVHFYGSRMIGIANHYSDLDIFVELRNNFFKSDGSKDEQAMIAKLAKAMRRSSEWDVQIALPGATVPLLRCVFLPNGLKCDITVANGLGVVNSRLLCHLFGLQRETIKFFHAIRISLKIMGVSFKRHQVMLLVLFFLQNQNIMPSIVKVQKGLRPQTIDGWEVQFNPNRSRIDYSCKKMICFKDYLKDFFEFYSSFNFLEFVIVPNLGKAVERDNYPNRPSMKRFNVNLRNFKLDKPMAVASVLSVDYNVFYDVGVKRLANFVNSCHFAKELLINNGF